jgi:hypothetical protein
VMTVMVIDIVVVARSTVEGLTGQWWIWCSNKVIRTVLKNSYALVIFPSYEKAVGQPHGYAITQGTG